MFNNLINLFAKPLDEVKPAIDEKGILALSAIFIRIAKLDGSFDISERQKIKELIENRFDLDKEKIGGVLHMAAKLEGQSNDNVQEYTSFNGNHHLSTRCGIKTIKEYA